MKDRLAARRRLQNYIDRMKYAQRREHELATALRETEQELLILRRERNRLILETRNDLTTKETAEILAVSTATVDAAKASEMRRAGMGAYLK